MAGNKGVRVILNNVRLSFPALFRPEAFKKGDEPKFKATGLIDKTDPQIKTIEAAISEVAKEKWGAQADKIIKGIRGNANKFCFQDGDSKDYDGYQGKMALSAKSASRPTVLDRDKTPLTETDGKPYAGCYVDLIVDLFAYENSGNGVSASLKAVRFRGDGDAFSGGKPADPDEFDDLDASGSGDDDIA